MKEHGSGLAGGPFPAGSAVPTPVAQRRVPPFVGVLVSVGMLGAAACAAGLGGGELDLGSPAPGRLLPGQVFRDCDVCPEMVVVPPGSYMMGSPEDEVGRYFNEEPRHLVRIAHSFAVGVHEVTFIQWDACVAASPPSADTGTDMIRPLMRSLDCERVGAAASPSWSVPIALRTRRRWRRTERTRSGYTTCWATCGSGRRTVGTGRRGIGGIWTCPLTPIWTLPLTEAPGCQVTVTVVCCAAAPGSTLPGASVPPTAWGTVSGSGTAPSGSVLLLEAKPTSPSTGGTLPRNTSLPHFVVWIVLAMVFIAAQSCARDQEPVPNGPREAAAPEEDALGGLWALSDGTCIDGCSVVCVAGEERTFHESGVAFPCNPTTRTGAIHPLFGSEGSSTWRTWMATVTSSSPWSRTIPVARSGPPPESTA